MKVCNVTGVRIINHFCGDLNDEMNMKPFVQIDLQEISLSEINNINKLSMKSSNLTNAKLNRIIIRIINIVNQNKDYHNFKDPVSKDLYPDYYIIIKNPMDFSKIINKAWNNLYNNTKEFVIDINLIRDNCSTYCKDDFPELVETGKQLTVEVNKFLELFMNDNDNTYNKVNNDITTSNKLENYTICQRIGEQYPIFLVSIKMYNKSLENCDSIDDCNIEQEGRLSMVTGKENEEIENFGIIITNKNALSNGLLPWNSLLIEWLPLQNILPRVQEVNPWEINMLNINNKNLLSPKKREKYSE